MYYGVQNDISRPHATRANILSTSYMTSGNHPFIRKVSHLSKYSSYKEIHWFWICNILITSINLLCTCTNGFLLMAWYMRGSRKFWEWGFRPYCQKNHVFFLFFLVLNVFYSFTVVYQWFISKKTIILQGFRGGPTFSRGVHHFSGGPTFSRGGV